MKKLIVILLLCSLGVAAQDFEGYVNYSFRMAGGEDNPEVTAAGAFLPTDFSYKVKGDKAMMSIKGGLMARMMGNMLIDAANNTVYILNEAQKTAYKADPKSLSSGGQNTPSPDQVEVKKTSEYKTIAGYKCRKHMVYITDRSGKNEQILWIADKLRIKNAGIFSNMGNGTMAAEQIKGMPLMIEAKADGMNVVMEATEVREERYKEEDFEIPAGFSVQDFNPAQMFGNFSDY